MICSFCGETCDDHNALQAHQAFSCQAIQRDGGTAGDENPPIIVVFLWIPDEEIQEEVVYLIGSNLINNVELKKDDGTFKSDGIQVPMGDFTGQLVVGDDIVPLNEFRIDDTSDTIYLTKDTDSMSNSIVGNDVEHEEVASEVDDENSSLHFSLHSIQSPRDEDAPSLPPSLTPSLNDNDDNEEGEDTILSPLHKEMLEHQLQQPDPTLGNLINDNNNFGGLLTEEKFDTSPRNIDSRTIVRSPDDHTLHNVEELSQDKFASEHPRGNPNAPSDIHRTGSLLNEGSNNEERDSNHQNDQMYFANDNYNEDIQSLESQHSSHLEETIQNKPNVSVDQMLNELSMTDQEHDLALDINQLQSEIFQSHGGEQHEMLNKLDVASSRDSQDGTPRSRASVRSKTGSARSSTHQSGMSKDSQRMQLERDQLLTEYQIKCETHKQEMQKKNSELKRLQDLTENYKEVKLELETKCLSSSVEIERLKNEIQKHQQIIKKHEAEHEDLVKDLLFDKQDLTRKCQNLEDELERSNEENQRIGRQLHEASAVEKRDDNDEMIAELEAKCQSYDMELESVTRDNQDVKNKLAEAFNLSNSLTTKYRELEVENQRLAEENQSLETAQKLHEEDVKNERDNMNNIIKKLQKDIFDLTSNYENQNHGLSSPSDNKAKGYIEKLNKENKLLKDKLKLIRVESDVAANDTSSPILSSTLRNSPVYTPSNRTPPYQPQIVTTTRQSLSSNTTYRSPDQLPHKSKPLSLPLEPTSRRTEEMTNGYTSRVLPSRYNPSDYTNNTHSNHSNSHSPTVNGRIIDDSYDERLDNIMRRYSTESRKENSLYDAYLPTKKHSENTYTGYDHNYNSYNKRSTNKRVNNKSRSLDIGLDSIGLNDNENYGSMNKRYDSLTRIPFCPTTVYDLKIGMKVSVSRTSGRLSRGVVKWIGTLPNRYGDFVGVELETESGKHDGFFDGIQFFKCKHDRGVFVKFAKVIMAWK